MQQDCKYYTHITKLPLSKFIDVMCDENIEALIIEGQPTERELYDAWSEIQEQYAEAIGDINQKIYLTLYKDINRLANRLALIYFLIDQLKMLYVKQFARELNKLVNHGYVWSETDWALNDRNIKNCISRCKGKEMELAKKKAQLQKLQPEGEGEKPTREYFQTMLNVLEEHFKTAIDENITVFRYAERVKRLHKSIKK